MRWILPAFLGRGEALKNTAKIHCTFRENQQRRSYEALCLRPLPVLRARPHDFRLEKCSR
ncbi:hypothetical protein HMPREF9996_00644 [Aggregatibacter actinomycetemcomitans Y4]|uniref:Uncharacterized protein n=1 Tax=Aggregatibacter actinomycetemcomitans TaxID=714 RepID=A0AB74N7W4_AGGAC|nr:hypothetical protein HMPREF9996_00644 [Aggregatibacter actinomycetemcomitans Y4]OZV18807.1 hypothetical protein RO04_03175 [Aggregatibacter actinomycetemcomitans]PHO21653.1 hypothetical protein CQR80_00720 [Aggregatibacter actinomycetemcomitans]PHO23892.1 hypothetical protein CQR79_00755 [Aggregatibacter actinomycetemcomitans]TYA22125.1 hypothetical protein FXE08_01530 [Aggregatibacter actinomycetemcomitans]